MLKLLENFWLKVIALAMGLFVWFHVATEKTYNYELHLPVMQIDLQEGLTLANNPPESLLIEVSAVGKQLLRQDWREEGLRINLARHESGALQTTLNPDNITLRKTSSSITLDAVVYPAEFEFDIDRLGETRVPVVADVNAVANEGFAVIQPITVLPDEVTLFGPVSLLDGFKSVATESRQLTGLRDNITLRLPLMSPPSYGVRLEPDSVTVSLEVVPVKTRIFDNVQVAVYNVPPRHTFITEPAAVSIELTGSPEEIDLLDANALTVSADYRRADEYGIAPIKIDFPSNFTIRKQTTSTVRIIIEPDVDPGN